MAPIQIDFEHVLNAYKTIHVPHNKNAYFQEILNNHSCFNEIKWKDNTPKVRAKKFGAGTDMSDGSVFKKDLTSLLNKASSTNRETISKKVVALFKIEYATIFVNTIWEYFKIQPMYQYVYIHLLKDVYATLNAENINAIKLIWEDIWYIYRKKEEWKINITIVENSHSYNDFCDYIKEKKKLNAIAEGFSKLMTEHIINDDEKYIWINDVIDWCNTFDLTNVIYKTIVDSCIEQIRDFCKTNILSQEIHDRLIELNTKPLQKATYFKIKDLTEKK